MHRPTTIIIQKYKSYLYIIHRTIEKYFRIRVQRIIIIYGFSTNTCNYLLVLYIYSRTGASTSIWTQQPRVVRRCVRVCDIYNIIIILYSSKLHADLNIITDVACVHAIHLYRVVMLMRYSCLYIHLPAGGANILYIYNTSNIFKFDCV